MPGKYPTHRTIHVAGFLSLVHRSSFHNAKGTILTTSLAFPVVILELKVMVFPLSTDSGWLHAHVCQKGLLSLPFVAGIGT